MTDIVPLLGRGALFITVLSLAGCANAVNGTPCTSLISSNGGLLQFCQTNEHVAITETGLAGRDVTLKIIGDPSTLAALSDHLKFKPKFIHSRKIIAKACVVAGANYVSMKMPDLERIIDRHKSNY